MAKYKILISKDEVNFFWVVVDWGRVIWNPTEDDFKGAIRKSYSKTNICPTCIEENNMSDNIILCSENAYHDIDKNGNRIEKIVCRRHHHKNYQKYDPNSQHNIIKSMSNRRIGNLTYDIHIFADHCEELTCKVFGIKNLNKEDDNYHSPIDHSPIPEGILVMTRERLVDLSGKIPQTKGSRITIRRVGILEYEDWHGNFVNEHNKKFDILIIYCINKDGNIIERIYIFPYSEIIKKGQITIVKNPIRGTSHIIPWYEKYRVTEEYMLCKANKIWKDIRKEIL